MEYLRIDGLRFQGKHGVHADERHTEQEFEISIVMHVDTKVAGKSDRLADTVDYAEVRDRIQNIVEGKSRYLVEALAEDIAEEILKDSRITSTEVTVRKTEVWDNGIPGVTIVRGNK